MITIVPIGPVEPEILVFIRETVGRRFKTNIESAPAIPVPARAYNARRRQYDSRILLDELERQLEHKRRPAVQIAQPVAGIADGGRPDGSPPNDKTLGVISADTFTNGMNFVFGQALLGGCCGVISLARLYNPDGTPHHGEFDLSDIEKIEDSDSSRAGSQNVNALRLSRFFERIEKESVHELGHTFGLRHCANPRCVMYYSSIIEDTDNKSADFCTECG